MAQSRTLEPMPINGRITLELMSAMEATAKVAIMGNVAMETTLMMMARPRTLRDHIGLPSNALVVEPVTVDLAVE